jgi:hypothetical protein
MHCSYFVTPAANDKTKSECLLAVLLQVLHVLMAILNPDQSTFRAADTQNVDLIFILKLAVFVCLYCSGFCKACSVQQGIQSNTPAVQQQAATAEIFRA